MQKQVSNTTWNQFLDGLASFDNKLALAVTALGIDVSGIAIDHACIRLQSPERAETLLTDLLNVGRIISTEEINGRPIHIVQLTEPLSILGKDVYGLEVPYPKPGQQYAEGFEHIEFVLPNVAENTARGIEQAFFNYFPHLDHERLVTDFQFKVTEPGADTDQLPNPTVGIKISDIGLKFHAHPIQKVVGYV